MKTRTKEQIMESKAIYAKHAERYKAMNDEQQDRRARRMLAYTSVLTKAVSVAMANRYMPVEPNLAVEVIETTVAHISEVLEVISEERAEMEVFANYCDYCGHEEDKSYNAIEGLAICDSCLPFVQKAIEEQASFDSV